jgi:hypothetical protein
LQRTADAERAFNRPPQKKLSTAQNNPVDREKLSARRTEARPKLVAYLRNIFPRCGSAASIAATWNPG